MYNVITNNADIYVKGKRAWLALKYHSHCKGHQPGDPYHFPGGLQQYLFCIMLYLFIAVLFAGNKSAVNTTTTCKSPHTYNADGRW